LLSEARRRGARAPYSATTPYLNTIPPQQQAAYPGDLEVEHRIRSMIRWNAAAMVLRANKESSELGGHIASFQSAATLYDVGFEHFWHAPSDRHGGDLIYMQGHSSPGIYARAFVEGRLDEATMDRFRQEVDGGGLWSYPPSTACSGSKQRRPPIRAARHPDQRRLPRHLRNPQWSPP
jgi:pyruvate dehydrogenase E1 component